MKLETFNLQLKNYYKVTPTVLHMVFKREDGQPLNYTPGQFITIYFDWNDQHYKRSYSIASIPTQTDDIEIAVSPFTGGPGTEFLFNMDIGDTVQTAGPFGRLTLRDEIPNRYIMTATGTGVTPYRSMLPELHRRIEEHNIEVAILLGVQTRADLLYGEDFISFAAQHPNFQFHAFYSREMPEHPQPYEHQGYVQNYFPQLTLDANKDVVFLCGNPGMIDAAFKQLVEQNFTAKQIRREKYISPKR